MALYGNYSNLLEETLVSKKVVENNKNIMEVGLGEAIDFMKFTFNTQPAKEARSILLVGQVGMGKTEGILEAMRTASAYGFNKPLNPVVRHLSQVHPLDMAGVGLDNKDKSMYYAKPPLYEELMKLPAPRGCFFDEIDRAQPMAQNAMLQFLLSHELNGYEVENTWVVAAANAWHAQYTYEMDKATASRLLILHVASKKDDWMKWAVNHRVDTRVLIAIEQCPDILNQHGGISDNSKEGGDNDGCLKVADPRSWKALSDALNAGMDTEYAAAFVGMNAAEKFKIFAKIQADYSKEIKQILQGKPVNFTEKFTSKTEEQRAMFCVYLAASGQITEIPIARNFLRNGEQQLDRERAYIASKLITYNIEPTVLCEDPEIRKMHIDMVREIGGTAGVSTKK